jgi:DNA-binding MurR/RpiR family transcriptional regulator
MNNIDGIAQIVFDMKMVVCTGVGKSSKVADLVADLLQSVGTRAVSIHATDLLHGGMNVLPMSNRCMVIFFTHSGATAEVITALHHVLAYTNALTLFVTSATHVDGADYVLSYECVENNRHKTVPVQASIAQLATIGAVVDRIADQCDTSFLLRGHPKGELARVYERTTHGQ